MNHTQNTFKKIERVVLSCKTVSHLIGANNYISLWKKTLNFPADANMYNKICILYNQRKEQIKKAL